MARRHHCRRLSRRVVRHPAPLILKTFPLPPARGAACPVYLFLTINTGDWVPVTAITHPNVRQLPSSSSHTAPLTPVPYATPLRGWGLSPGTGSPPPKRPSASSHALSGLLRAFPHTRWLYISAFRTVLIFPARVFHCPPLSVLPPMML